jgi:hypothetical protein
LEKKSFSISSKALWRALKSLSTSRICLSLNQQVFLSCTSLSNQEIMVRGIDTDKFLSSPTRVFLSTPSRPVELLEQPMKEDRVYAVHFARQHPHVGLTLAQVFRMSKVALIKNWDPNSKPPGYYPSQVHSPFLCLLWYFFEEFKSFWYNSSFKKVFLNSEEWSSIWRRTFSSLSTSKEVFLSFQTFSNNIEMHTEKHRTA